MTASSTRPSYSDAEREALVAERDFLLGSIRDLQAERGESELCEEQYEVLLDRYTVRAARVLRALERIDGAPTSPTARKSRWPGAWLGLAAVLVISAVVLPSALSARAPGQTITGNQQTAPPTGDRLAARVDSRPDDPAARRAYASWLLSSGELVDALQQFDAAAALDPSDAESRAYAGWIVFLAGLTAPALDRLDAAIAADPSYPDAHAFRGMVLGRGRNDADAAVIDLRRFMELAPGHPMRDEVEDLLRSLEERPGAREGTVAEPEPVDPPERGPGRR